MNLKRAIVLTLIATCWMSFATHLATNADVRATQQTTQQTESGAEGRPTLWQDPVDLESRDLFYGIGGVKGAPDPASKFRFVEREKGGNSEKIVVEDERDRRWVVKFGPETRPETTATRIVWAVGYHTDEDYFVKRARIEGRGGFDVWDVRFERDNDGFKKAGRWAWQDNPFKGTRELDGLKVLMALLNNFDLKTLNNKIVRPGKKKASEEPILIYYVNDLGATLGGTGSWYLNTPLLGEIPSGTKGNPGDYARSTFIERVSEGQVFLHSERRRAKRAISPVKVEHARWMGNLLARLSDRQLEDAFRAGGFDEQETASFLRTIRSRIKQLQELK